MPYFRLFYHFVWATKDRLPLITELNRIAIYASAASKITELRGITHAIGGMPDHIHVVATIPPSVALSLAVGQIKGSTSHLASRLQPAHYEPFAWQPEYAVLSVTESQLPLVVRYVQNQERHHAQNTLKQRLEIIDNS